MDLGTEARKLAIEIIATLVHVKNTMAELILKPAGIPTDVYNPFLYRRDPATGRTLTKRQIAPLLLCSKWGQTFKSHLTVLKATVRNCFEGARRRDR